MAERWKLALGRGLARADTWVGVLALWFSGNRAADEQWVLAAILALVGLVFIVAAGDYCWRRGYVVGRKEGGAS